MLVNLTVKAVVDAVNNVFSSRGLGHESALVLLDNILLSRGKSWNAVDICDALVWSVGNNLSGGIWVHAWKTKVGANVGVVDVNDLGSSEVGNILVVDNGVGGEGKGGGTESGSSTKEGTTVGFGVEGGLGRGLCVGCERSGGAKKCGIAQIVNILLTTNRRLFMDQQTNNHRSFAAHC